MTAEELAALHPRLFHVTAPGAWPSIMAHGLLPSRALLELCSVDSERKAHLLTRRRPQEVAIGAVGLIDAVLNDNMPLSEGKLAACLDDGLRPEDWLSMLNERVFFWTEEARVESLLGARMNRKRARDVLVLDTLGLVRESLERVELSPINTGATIHRPARRGLKTFTPVSALSFEDWRRQRGKRDRIVELVVRGGVADVDRHLVERREVQSA